jgi:hypothetical protein
MGAQDQQVCIGLGHRIGDGFIDRFVHHTELHHTGLHHRSVVAKRDYLLLAQPFGGFAVRWQVRKARTISGSHCAPAPSSKIESARFGGIPLR